MTECSKISRTKVFGLKMTKQNQVSFEIAPSSEDAARLVMDWRNDPQTLANSFNQALKVWPEFYQEYKQEYVNDPTLPCFFAWVEGRRVGFLRFRRQIDSTNGSKNSCVDISINIDPARRGKGLGKLTLSSVVQQLGGTLRALGMNSLLAEIKLDNISSQKAFMAAGFKYLDEVEHPSVNSQSNVKIKRYQCELVSTAQGPGTRIGDGFPCFIIAEAGSNWRMGGAARDLKMGKTLIEVAKEAGCDAVKFQTYRPETTYVSNAGESDYLASNGIKQDISEIFKDLAMPYEMLQELADHARGCGITFMSSPFSAKDLEEVDRFTQLHKIASYEINHVRLIEAAAKTNKTVIFSSGASSIEDIDFAVNYFRTLSSADLCLMQCTAKYPSPISALNLSVIPYLKKLFGVPVGLSDHSRDPIVGPLAAVAVGANLIEKHYTLSNDLPGPDHKFAVTPKELEQMVSAVRNASDAMGNGIKQVLDEEQELFYFARRALQATKDIALGEPFLEDKNFAILRPGKQKQGMNPRHIDQLQNSKSNRTIKAGDGIQADDLNHS